MDGEDLQTGRQSVTDQEGSRSVAALLYQGERSTTGKAGGDTDQLQTRKASPRLRDGYRRTGHRAHRFCIRQSLRCDSRIRQAVRQRDERLGGQVTDKQLGTNSNEKQQRKPPRKQRQKPCRLFGQSTHLHPADRGAAQCKVRMVLLNLVAADNKNRSCPAGCAAIFDDSIVLGLAAAAVGMLSSARRAGENSL
jgi:hypothetical protein